MQSNRFSDEDIHFIKELGSKKSLIGEDSEIRHFLYSIKDKRDEKNNNLLHLLVIHLKNNSTLEKVFSLIDADIINELKHKENDEQKIPADYMKMFTFSDVVSDQL